MCISNLKTAEKQIAEEDITVLKVIRKNKGELCSPVFYEIWKVGSEKTINLNIINDRFDYPNKSYMTTTGFYSFDSSCDPKFCSMAFGHLGESLEVYEAIIPKGAEYIKEGNRFCSNKLKLIKKVL